MILLYDHVALVLPTFSDSQTKQVLNPTMKQQV